jgi:spermidine synthase
MFFVSGFCGLLYQTVWLRLAFACFGVITPVVSVVVSVFMLGLGLGSWLGGLYVEPVSRRLRVHPIALYGGIELVIGLGAFVVPALFASTSRALLGLGQSDSWPYLAASGLGIFVSILPFSCAMGATYPAALRALEVLPGERGADRRRFGRLYAFNTAGAVAGVLVTVYALIELVGLRRVLIVGFCGNLAVAVIAGLWGRKVQRLDRRESDRPAGRDPGAARATPRSDLTMLFVTGFCSMAMEVGWVRSFTPVLEHAVYAFAFLLAAYLVGHALGASAHTLTAARGSTPARELLVGAALVTAALPILFSEWDWAPGPHGWIVPAEAYCIALAIGAFAATLGWLTPMLVDEVSMGRPRRAGTAYAVNVVGCMSGPLVMGYVLLPWLGARIALIVLCVPLAGLLVLGRARLPFRVGALGAGAALLVAASVGRSFEEGAPLDPGETQTIYRDYMATTIARELRGARSLLVNGVPMTSRSPITQMMAHLPLSLHGSPPRKVLVICLGMGATYRSALSWDGVDVTVVELVSGVVRAYRDLDGKGEAREAGGPSSTGRIVVDDGRRYLARTEEKFDAILVDPPPPPGQPASSLLYSVEFYDLLKRHLNPGGLVQQWWGFPFANRDLTAAMARTVFASFPHVRVFRAVDDPARQMSGFHFVSSLVPMPTMTAAQFLARLPQGARRDLQRWTVQDAEGEMEARLAQQVAREIDWVASSGPLITDDRPFNEYDYLRERGYLLPADRP